MGQLVVAFLSASPTMVGRRAHPPINCQPFPLHAVKVKHERLPPDPARDTAGEKRSAPSSRCLQVNRAAVTFRKRRLTRQEDSDVVQFLCVGNLGCEPAGRFG